MLIPMTDYEKLGVFYLGRGYDLESGQTKSEPVLYDAKDLTTHAVCVGMTGSGKTGLCLSLLEEAAIDGIPAIAIDPKGDLGNLLLTFPELRPEDFEPWLEASEATRQGLTVTQLAARTAQLWRDGLAEWDQTPERIARLRAAADINIYTPGSEAGLPLSILRSFSAPGSQVLEDGEAFRERVLSAVSGLLVLLGVEADPIRSREHILLSHLLEHAWRAGRDLDLAELIREIQSPPFDKIGVLSLETMFPAKDRFGLAMQLNNVMASPGFASWTKGAPLDVQRLLYTAEGHPRLSIISISHLSDTERMFFVTMLLNEVVSWMRGQAGTSSLRAMLYMDEVFGYLPPSANPPSKLPLLTLLKQARAFGVGCVLATQNPVDLDYKALSNAGTWFLGRLQTERDKARVLDGLEGASAASGARFDRAQTEQLLSRLGKRVFLMNNVHDDEPTVFQSRWALSFLRGPLTRAQISTLMAPRREAEKLAAADNASINRTRRSAAPSLSAAGATIADRSQAESPHPAASPLPSTADASTAKAQALPSDAAERPLLPPAIEERFLVPTRTLPSSAQLLYRPALYGLARAHYVRAAADLDLWQTVIKLALLTESVPDDPWEEADDLSAKLTLQSQPLSPARFGKLPTELSQARNYGPWKTALKNFLYRERPLVLFDCKLLKCQSQVGEDEGTFRIRLKQRLHEHRDLELEKLRKRYAPKLKTLQDRIRTAETAVQREKSQRQEKSVQAALSVGTTLLGALFGRKMLSSSNVTKAASAMRSAGRVTTEYADVARAEQKLAECQKELAELEAEFQAETDQLRTGLDPDRLELTELTIQARKTDLTVEQVLLVWTPWFCDAQGVVERAY